MDWVTDRVAIGNFKDASAHATDVDSISCLKPDCCDDTREDVEILCRPLNDGPGNHPQDIDDAIEFVAETVNAERTILVHCHANGGSWSIESAGTPHSLHGVWASGPNNVIAVGDEGTIVRFDGNAWAPMVSGTNWDLWSVWGAHSGDVWAVGADEPLRSNGMAWSRGWSADAAGLSSLHGSSASDVWAVGGNGAAYRWNGSTWLDAGLGGARIHLGSVWTDGQTTWAAGSALLRR